MPHVQLQAPVTYFYLLFTTTLLNTTVTETKRYVLMFLQGHVNPSPDSKAKRWKNVTLGKTKEFSACLLNMIIIRRPTIASFWYITVVPKVQRKKIERNLHLAIFSELYLPYIYHPVLITNFITL
jgi:hypothetical protein